MLHRRFFSHSALVSEVWLRLPATTNLTTIVKGNNIPSNNRSTGVSYIIVYSKAGFFLTTLFGVYQGLGKKRRVYLR